MYDTAHDQTEKLLNDLSNKIDKIYFDEYKSLEPKINKQLRVMYLADSTEYERIEYAKKNDKLKKLVFFIASAYVVINKNVLDNINNTLSQMYQLNRQWAINEIIDAVKEDVILKDMAFTLSKIQNKYDKRAYNRLKNASYVAKEIETRLVKGIRENMTLEQLENRIKIGAGFSRDSSLAIARTDTTRIENYVRYQTYLEAKRKGIKIEKMWISVLDNDTRKDHYEMYGETKNLEEYFSNGLLYPGDPDGEAKEVIHCRCRIVAVITINGRKKVVNGILNSKNTA